MSYWGIVKGSISYMSPTGLIPWFFSYTSRTDESISDAKTHSHPFFLNDSWNEPKPQKRSMYFMVMSMNKGRLLSNFTPNSQLGSVELMKSLNVLLILTRVWDSVGVIAHPLVDIGPPPIFGHPHFRQDASKFAT